MLVKINHCVYFVKTIQFRILTYLFIHFFLSWINSEVSQMPIISLYPCNWNYLNLFICQDCRILLTLKVTLKFYFSLAPNCFVYSSPCLLYMFLIYWNSSSDGESIILENINIYEREERESRIDFRNEWKSCLLCYMICSLIKLPKLFTISTPHFFNSHYAHVKEVICKKVHFFLFITFKLYMDLIGWKLLES